MARSIYILYVCGGKFFVFFPPPLYFFLFSNFAAAIWFTQSKVASLQCSSSFPHQGPEWQFQQPLGKGLGCFTCDMKADELIKSCLRCGKYWCTCYEASAKLVTKGSEYFGGAGISSFAIHKSWLTLVHCSPLLEAQSKIFRSYL